MQITSTQAGKVATPKKPRAKKAASESPKTESAGDAVQLSGGKPAPANTARLAQQGSGTAAQAATSVCGLGGTAIRMILTGPPGGGKGTQADLIKQFFKGTTHLSTGELLRQQVKEGTELGKQAQVYMQKGELVPDSIILAMVDEKLAQEESFILDGFPRSTAQAQHLDETLARLGKPLTAVANLQVDDEIVVKRLKERGRQDDTEEIIRNRLKVYHEQTEPVIGHYQAQGLLEQVEAEGKVAQVGYNMITQLNSRLRPHGC